MSQPERRAVPVLSVMDMVPVSAGCSRTDALTDMIALARAADAAGYERYWLAEHHGSTTYLSSATIVLMGQVLAATERLGVASGGIMLPNHAPLVVAEIELPAEDTPFERPSWLGREITADGRYTNAYLSKHPYSDWTPQEREA